jgi:hypothetical protein
MSSDQERVLSARDDRHRQERGAIIIFVALGLVVLIGMMGLAFDLGHAYVNKSQLQNIADACALAGASALNGSAAGIIEAETRATDYGSSLYLANKTEFNKQLVAIPPSAVTYSTALTGPWLDQAGAQATAASIRFVRVDVPAQQTDVLFAKVVPGIPAALNFGAEAVAGQQPLTEACAGLDPFSPVALGPENSNDGFGYELGKIYSIRLSPGTSGKNCSEYGLMGSVTGNFGLADPSGTQPSLTGFRDNILNGNYSNCVAIEPSGIDATPKDGGAALLRAIQDRFDQDKDPTPYLDYSAYLIGYRNKLPITTNWRRHIRVAFNDTEIPNGAGMYNVLGFGCFFMPVRTDVHPPSAAICLMYVGTCNQSGAPGGGNKPSLTKVVLFR